jgi:hypothetical protein
MVQLKRSPPGINRGTFVGRGPKGPKSRHSLMASLKRKKLFFPGGGRLAARLLGIVDRRRPVKIIYHNNSALFVPLSPTISVRRPEPIRRLLPADTPLISRLPSAIHVQRHRRRYRSHENVLLARIPSGSNFPAWQSRARKVPAHTSASRITASIRKSCGAGCRNAINAPPPTHEPTRSDG